MSAKGWVNQVKYTSDCEGGAGTGMSFTGGGRGKGAAAAGASGALGRAVDLGCNGELL
jgi:hypothetical protein